MKGRIGQSWWLEINSSCTSKWISPTEAILPKLPEIGFLLHFNIQWKYDFSGMYGIQLWQCGLYWRITDNCICILFCPFARFQSKIHCIFVFQSLSTFDDCYLSSSLSSIVTGNRPKLADFPLFHVDLCKQLECLM